MEGENIKNQIYNNTDENIKEGSINKILNNSNFNFSNSNIRIQNKKYIEEIFKYSEEINELISIFKENSIKIIKEFFDYLIQILYDEKEKKENLNEDEMKLICYNLRELKEIFLKSSEIIEQIQFNKEYYNEEYKENRMIGILFDLYINTSNNKIKITLEEIFISLNQKIIYQK